MPQHQSQERIQQLLKQFPFLNGIYRSEVGPVKGVIVPEIRVQRGDPELMFRQADNVDGGSQQLIDPRDSLVVGTRYEYYQPVNHQGQVGEVRHWQTWKDQFVRDLFSREINDWLAADEWRGQDPTQVVSSLVWVARNVWYPDGTKFGSRLGIPSADPVRTNVSFTVYQEPEGGWRKLYRSADPLSNVRLHGWRLFSGSNFDGYFNRAINDRLNRLGWEFQDRVWMTGLGAIVDASRMRGMSGRYGDVTVLTYIIAGRLQVQFERGDASLTLVGVEASNPRLGFGSIDGTVRQAEQMVRDVIDFWEAADEATRQSIHRDNTDVGVGF